MIYLIYLLMVIPGIFVLIWIGDWIAGWLLTVPDTHDGYHTVTTEDDTELSLWHYESSETNSSRRPVLLVHGLTANHRNLAFDERYGLAHYLNEHGYDCWSIDLRGRGKNTPDASWNFDHYLRYDIPATIEYVLDRTGADSLHWIGHSMGGMLYLAYTGTKEDPRIRSGVTIGSPVYLDRPKIYGWLGSSFLSLPDPVYRSVKPVLNVGLAGMAYSLPLRLWLLFMMDSISLKALKVAQNAVVTRTDHRVFRQFFYWISTGEWTSDDGSVCYRSKLEDVNVPTFTVIGRYDHLCPDPETAGYHDLDLDRKNYTVASRENGYSRNHDHLSLVFGESAREEIFPEIRDWLSSHE